jgi:hypothetical protein
MYHSAVASAVREAANGELLTPSPLRRPCSARLYHVFVASS